LSHTQCPPQVLNEVVRRIQAVSGLAVEGGGFRKSLEQTLARHIKAHGTDAPEYLSRLLRDDAQLARLIEDLTIGETYFFRHPGQFRLLAHEILPELLGRRQHLRLWSSACATGEEPYTLALTVCRFLPPAERSRVSILGTDLNPAFLQHARAGVYGRRAVRFVPPEDLQRFFAVRDGRYLLDDEVKRLVTFQRINLHDPASYPQETTGAHQCDVILCRNVLIYFDGASARGVIERLAQALRPDGVLVLGPSEHSFERPGTLRRCQLKEGIVYRRVKEGEKIIPMLREARPAHKPSRRPAVVAKVIELPRPIGEELARDAWVHAERERFQEAIETAGRALAVDPLDPSLHLLMGVLSDRSGNRLEAAEWFRKALYLDPRHLLSRFYLANAYRGLGERVAAEREFTAVLRYLKDRPVEELIEDEQRMTAGALRQVCEKAIGRLKEPVMGSST